MSLSCGKGEIEVRKVKMKRKFGNVMLNMYLNSMPILRSDKGTISSVESFLARMCIDAIWESILFCWVSV